MIKRKKEEKRRIEKAGNLQIERSNRQYTAQHIIALSSMNECSSRNEMFGKLWLVREGTKTADKTETCCKNENENK